MRFRFAPLAATIAAGLPLLALLPTASATPLRQATDLDEVVVTATRTPGPLASALAPAEVLDREAIERSQALSLPELLRGRAGISLSNQGGAGKLTTLFLRGAESDQTVVLVDGIHVGSSTSGLASWQNLPVELIERIEIVRGPRSSLYGADAIGGVIQIFTRREGNAHAPRMHVGGGSDGAHRLGTGFGGAVGRGWFGADYAFQRTEGFDSCEVARPTPFSGGCFISQPQPDLDGYREHSLSLRGGIDFNEDWQLRLQALRGEGDNEFDGDFSDRSETVQQVVGGTLSWHAGEALDLTLTAGRNVDASEQYLGTGPAGHFSTDRDSATLQADIDLARGHLLTVGGSWLRDRVVSDTVYDLDRRSNRAGFIQYQGQVGRHALQASARRDDNDQFGAHNTGAVAWGFDLGAGWRVSAAHGTAFKAPTFNELYYPFFGNPALAPEASDSSELGLAWQGVSAGVRLDAFDTRVDDLIAFDAALGLPNNIDSARMRGAELGARAAVAQWTLDASVSWLDTENRSALYPGHELPRRASESARIDVDRTFGQWRLGLTGVAEGSRFDDVANTTLLPGYATFDLRAEVALTSGLTLQARLANVFDRDYQTARFYRQPGRQWFVTVRWAPQG